MCCSIAEWKTNQVWDMVQHDELGGGDIGIQIIPMRVRLLYQVDFPISMPALELLFVVDSILDLCVRFKPYEFCQIILLCEDPALAFAMLMNAPNQVGGNAYI